MLTEIESDTWPPVLELDEAVMEFCLQQLPVSITHLWINDYEHAGHPEEHDALPVGTEGRHYIRGGNNRKLTVSWEVQNIEKLESAGLYIYDKSDVLLACVDIDNTKKTYDFNELPSKWLANEPRCANGPCLVRLVITKVKGNVQIGNRARRAYFDVMPLVVVGGGIAGIRTAELLLEHESQQEVVLVEARHYLGGRARTVAWEGFDIDLGCQFLQDAALNPLVKLATDYDRENYWQIQDQTIFWNGVKVDKDEAEKADNSVVVWHPVDEESYLYSLCRGLVEGGEVSDSAMPAEDVTAGMALIQQSPVGKILGDLQCDDSVKIRVYEELNKPLIKMHMAMNAELDEGIDASQFTRYQDVDEDEEDQDQGKYPYDTGNKLVVGGLGGLIAHHAGALVAIYGDRLKIITGCKVSEVDTSDNTGLVKISARKVGLEVDLAVEESGDAGEKVHIYGYGLALTVPTEIIRRKKISFIPELPNKILNAFEALPMGHYKKIFLPLKPDAEVSVVAAAASAPVQSVSSLFARLQALAKGGVSENDVKTDVSIFTLDEQGVTWKFLYLVEKNLIVTFIGGQAAHDADNMEDIELVTRILKVLDSVFSQDSDWARNSWNGKFTSSKWSKDQLSFGSYSYTTPNGGTQGRKDLREGVVADCMVFAGEAVRASKDEFATAHGAWMSGHDAANLLLTTLGFEVKKQLDSDEEL